MKKAILIPIIVGGALLVTGSLIFAIALANNSKSSALVTNEYQIKEDFHNIDVDIDTSNLEFKTSEDGQGKIVFEERKKEHHEASVSADTLKIKYVDERKWSDRIFNINLKSMKVTVYLPNQEYGDLTIKNDTGEIYIPADFTFNKTKITVHTGDISYQASVKETIEIKASTGDIHFSDLKAQSISTDVSTGNVTYNNVQVIENITAKSSTGDIKLEKVTANNLTIKASTGKVTLIDSVMVGHTEINTSTGRVNFQSFDSASIKVKTSTGDVKGTLLTNKIFYAHSDTGRVNVPKSTEGGLCEIDTDTGDISIQIVNN